ncbi:MAG TPA: hypothetical protein VMD99_04680 [Terriglobales bacterium]|nr:hypothetical protein [Terriglobales bacterium]
MPLSRSKKPLKLRVVRFDDHAQISALVSKFDLHIEDYSGWTHLWSDNPAYREIAGIDQDKFPMGWVLENGDGAICGYLGNVPLQYELEGKKLLAATTRAWVVDTPYRSYSPLLLGTYFQQPNVDLFLSTTVNAQSAPAYSIFEGIRVPRGAWDRALFWITDYRGFTESFLRNKGWAIAKPLSYPLSAGLFLRDQLMGSRVPGGGRRIMVQSCLGFDDRFDGFWAALRKKKSNVLLAVRSREALDWHFKFALEHKTAWIFTVEDGSGLSAYSVFLRSDYRQIGLTRMRLVDFQCLERDRSFFLELLRAMLHAAMKRCRQESIHMLELVGVDAELESDLKRTSPHTRSLSSWLYFYKASSPGLAEKLKNADVWEPSLFDGDSSL